MFYFRCWTKKENFFEKTAPQSKQNMSAGHTHPRATRRHFLVCRRSASGVDSLLGAHAVLAGAHAEEWGAQHREPPDAHGPGLRLRGLSVHSQHTQAHPRAHTLHIHLHTPTHVPQVTEMRIPGVTPVALSACAPRSQGRESPDGVAPRRHRGPRQLSDGPSCLPVVLTTLFEAGSR